MGGNVSRDDGTKTVTLTKDGAAGKPGETPITPGNDTEQTPSDNSETQTGTKSLVECFSVTGNTKTLAEKIAEQQDENARPEISEKSKILKTTSLSFSATLSCGVQCLKS